MLKRSIEVSTEGAYLSLKSKQLVIERKDKSRHTVPFEDLGFIVLASRGVTISSGALQAAAENNVAVITCGRNFVPSGLHLPLVGNTLHAERLNAQTQMSEPLKKQLWARLVREKVRMQASLHDTATKEKMLALAASVGSGDPQNIEAQAARIHWGNLFRDVDLPEPFRRDRDGPAPNGLLNYAYAIIRACIARALVGSGLHPALGIHHHNRYNAFALVDDLIEPYRAIADQRVLELVNDGHLDVTKDTKPFILNLLADRISVGSETSPFMIGVQRTTNSLSNIVMQAVESGTNAKKLAGMLELPTS